MNPQKWLTAKFIKRIVKKSKEIPFNELEAGEYFVFSGYPAEVLLKVPENKVGVDAVSLNTADLWGIEGYSLVKKVGNKVVVKRMKQIKQTEENKNELN